MLQGAVKYVTTILFIRLSVCLYVTLVYRVEAAKHIKLFFAVWLSHHFGFLTSKILAKFQLVNGALNRGGL